jgi:hypothetical protein
MYIYVCYGKLSRNKSIMCHWDLMGTNAKQTRRFYTVPVPFDLRMQESAKGDTPNDSNIWQGASANKFLDTFNIERFTILKSEFIKLKA